MAVTGEELCGEEALNSSVGSGRADLGHRGGEEGIVQMGHPGARDLGFKVKQS